MASSGETGKSPQEPDKGSEAGDQAQLPSSEPGIGAHGSQCVQGHYSGASSIFQSCATLVGPAAYAVAIDSKLPGKCGINGLTYKNKFLIDDAFVAEKGDHQCLYPGIFQTTFFFFW